MPNVKLWIILPLLFVYPCNAQMIKTLPKLVFSNMGYENNSLYIYTIRKTNTNNQVLKQDTLGLFITDKDKKQHSWEHAWAKLMAWQFITKINTHTYDFIEDRYDNTYTGIVINDSFFMLHPTRFSYLTDLQHCPYPYFHNSDSIGESWRWDLNIGSQWATHLYPIKSEDTFHFTYVFVDTLTLNTKFGQLFCRKIEGKCTSVFGISTATYFLNAQYGLVRYSVTDIDKSRYEFELIERGQEELMINQQSPRMMYRKKRTLEYLKEHGTWY